LSKSRYTATRGAPGSVTVLSYHLAPKLRTDRDSRRIYDLTAVSANWVGADDEAWIYLGNTLADRNPGDSADTAVVFDVPRGTGPRSIELPDGPFSDGVTVGL